MEQTWPDAHVRLIGYLCDALQAQLPEDLRAAAEEEVITIGGPENGQSFRPDVQVREPWAQAGSGGVTVAEPSVPPALEESEAMHILTDEQIHRWIEIRDRSGRLITVVELLSPANKTSLSERTRYSEKWSAFTSGGANVVAIDLVRQGKCVFPNPVCEALLVKGATYGVHVFRSSTPTRHKLYPVQFRQRLPVIGIPLRQKDSDILLDLQPLINQCHERGRYHLLNYNLSIDPPLSTEDAAWADGLLRASGLR